MDLLKLLKKLKKNNVNKTYVFYKNENGLLDNICYQNDVFFKVYEKDKVRFLNPIRVVDTLQEIQDGKLQLVGKGFYVIPVDFKKHYKKENLTWKLY